MFPKDFLSSSTKSVQQVQCPGILVSSFLSLAIHQFDALPVNLMGVYRIFPLKSFFGYDSGRILKYVSNLLRNSLNLAAFPSNSSTSGVFLSLALGHGSGVDFGEIVSILGRFFSLFLDGSGAGVGESSLFQSVSLLSLISSVINSRLGEGVLYSS